MSHTYPRLDSIRRYKQINPTNICEACDKVAHGRVMVQFNYMRGDDDHYFACKEHIEMARKESTFNEFIADCDKKHEAANHG